MATKNQKEIRPEPISRTLKIVKYLYFGVSAFVLDLVFIGLLFPDPTTTLFQVAFFWTLIFANLGIIYWFYKRE